MATYLVRTLKALRLVGIFAAKDPCHLFSIIDNGGDPFECEYLKMQDGEGLHVDARFIGDMRDLGDGEGKVFCVDIETVANPEKPRLTDNLSWRLEHGRSWTAFTAKNLAGEVLPSLNAAWRAPATGAMR